MKISYHKVELVMARGRMRATDICQAAGVSRPWWSETMGTVKRGAETRPATARKIADILGVDVTDILMDDHPTEIAKSA